MPLQSTSPSSVQPRILADEAPRRGGQRCWRAGLAPRLPRPHPSAAPSSSGFPAKPGRIRGIAGFLREAQLDHVGAFCPFAGEGAAANALPDAVPEEGEGGRLPSAAEVQAEISAARPDAKIGTRQQVLVDHVDADGAVARSKADAPEIDGIGRIDEGQSLKAAGQFVEVEIVHADEHDLIGRSWPDAPAPGRARFSSASPTPPSRWCPTSSAPEPCCGSGGRRGCPGAESGSHRGGSPGCAGVPACSAGRAGGIDARVDGVARTQAILPARRICGGVAFQAQVRAGASAGLRGRSAAGCGRRRRCAIALRRRG